MRIFTSSKRMFINDGYNKGTSRKTIDNNRRIHDSNNDFLRYTNVIVSVIFNFFFLYFLN